MNNLLKVVALFSFVFCFVGAKSEVIELDGKQYFVEKPAPGDVLSTKYLFEINHQLYSGRSDYQDIEVFNTVDYGNMLVLDGIVQATEKDEFIYHENICHLPMFYHSNPRKILIIGGGDGGSLRELLKHPIDEVFMVEIDEKVMEISNKYLPTLSNGAFDNEKANVIVGDGKAFIENHKDYFDVIVLDLSDPEGPAEELISESFYADVKEALKDGGVVSVQSESLTVQPELAATINRRLKNVFSSVNVHQIVVPTYEGGIFSITVASDIDLDSVSCDQIEKRYNDLNLDLKYYYPRLHFSSAILPLYLKKLLNETL